MKKAISIISAFIVMVSIPVFARDKTSFHDHRDDRFELNINDHNYVFFEESGPDKRLPSFNEDAHSLSKMKRINGEYVGTVKTETVLLTAYKTIVNGTISNCDTLISSTVGVAHGNTSYGGYCKLSLQENNKAKVTDIMVCNDEMVSHFSIKFIDRSTMTKEHLANFIISECYGG